MMSQKFLVPTPPAESKNANAGSDRKTVFKFGYLHDVSIRKMTSEKFLVTTPSAESQNPNGSSDRKTVFKFG